MLNVSPPLASFLFTASSAARVRRKTDPEVKRFQSIILPLHSRISTLKDGNIFQSPIKASEAPDYHDIVKRPIDLRTIKARVKDGIITNSSEYRRDVYLMFANAIMYNRPGSSVYRMAENVCLYFSPSVLILTSSRCAMRATRSLMIFGIQRLHYCTEYDIYTDDMMR